MICGSSGIANWRSRRGPLDPALGAEGHQPHFPVRVFNDLQALLSWTTQIV